MENTLGTQPGNWLWWFWLFFIENEETGKDEQLMVLWSTKNDKEIACNHLVFNPVNHKKDGEKAPVWFHPSNLKIIKLDDSDRRRLHSKQNKKTEAAPKKEAKETKTEAPKKESPKKEETKKIIKKDK